MGMLCWIVLGLVAGFIATKIVNGHGEGTQMDIVLGILGAVAGGWLFNAFGAIGVTEFNIWSLFVAVIGAIVALGLWHAVGGRTARA
ncbi:MAG: GlsB/YeaQ/YmgE family stress response membrane protein [Tepidisphaeraceae bacterium]